MTIEEVKQTVFMDDILQRYGICKQRSMVSCPKHKDKTPSMKIYKDGFRCFSCGWSGDIFDFVRFMDNLSFKEAFLSLGGAYEKPTFHSKMTIYHSKKTRETSEKKKKKKYYTMKEISESITKYRKQKEDNEPFSDEWCEAVNELEYLLYVYEEMYKIYCQC